MKKEVNPNNLKDLKVDVKKYVNKEKLLSLYNLFDFYSTFLMILFKNLLIIMLLFFGISYFLNFSTTGYVLYFTVGSLLIVLIISLRTFISFTKSIGKNIPFVFEILFSDILGIVIDIRDNSNTSVLKQKINNNVNVFKEIINDVYKPEITKTIKKKLPVTGFIFLPVVNRVMTVTGKKINVNLLKYADVNYSGQVDKLDVYLNSKLVEVNKISNSVFRKIILPFQIINVVLIGAFVITTILFRFVI